jgi:hypothetical protein
VIFSHSLFTVSLFHCFSFPLFLVSLHFPCLLSLLSSLMLFFL